MLLIRRHVTMLRKLPDAHKIMRLFLIERAAVCILTMEQRRIMELFLVYGLFFNTIMGSVDRIEEDILKILTYYNHSEQRLPTEKDKKATTVTVGILITDLKMDINKMQISLVFDLRQEWEDSRLNYTSLRSANETSEDKMWEEPYRKLRRDWSKYIWRPDIYVPNSISGTVFNYPIPNMAARLYANGTLKWIQRLSGVFPCSVDRLTFPLDTHICPIKLNSFDYSVDQLKLQWEARDLPVEFEEGFLKTEPSIDFEKTTLLNCSKRNHDGEMVSCIEVKLHIKKTNNIYILQVYFPSTLTVILSWLNFWIDREVIQARVSLGSLCVVTIMTHATGLPYILPDESMIKAIDVWEIMCIILVFAGMLEFALMHAMLMRRKHIQKAKELEDKLKGDIQETEREDMIAEDVHSIQKTGDERKLRKIRRMLRERWWHVDPSRIDIIARRLFPIIFVIFNIVYWVTYNYS